MIDHLSLPVSDYALSRTFYDKALGALGCKVQMEVADSPDYVGAGYGPADLPEPAFVLDPDGHRLEAVCHLPE